MFQSTDYRKEDLCKYCDVRFVTTASWNHPSVQKYRNVIDRWMSSDANQGAELPLACTGLFYRDRPLAQSWIRDEHPLSGATQLHLQISTPVLGAKEPERTTLGKQKARVPHKKAEGAFHENVPLPALIEHKHAQILTAASPHSITTLFTLFLFFLTCPFPFPHRHFLSAMRLLELLFHPPQSRSSVTIKQRHTDK